MNKILLAIIIGIGLFLLIYKLSTHMIFIGDQAWFYLSARDAILSHTIPLVGIPTSHPWLSQGPFWTYLLIPTLLITNFHPVSGGYLSIFFGLASIIGVFYVGKLYFSERVGLIAALFYATSPLIIINSRMPFDTAPVPFFTILFMITLYRWIKGNVLYFPVTILLGTILYNFVISTALLLLTLPVIIMYGVWKKEAFVKMILTKRILFFSFLAGLIPMIPMLLHDSTHGYPQTLKFTMWIGYRILQLLHLPFVKRAPILETGESLLRFRLEELQKLLFLPDQRLAALLFIVSIGIFLFSFWRLFKNNTLSSGIVLLSLIFFVPFLGFLGVRTNSEAYLPIFYPSLMILIAVTINSLMTNKVGWYISLFLLISISFSNGSTLIQREYLLGRNGYGLPIDEQIRVSKNIITLTQGKPYILKRVDSPYESATMNYEYLTWWLGRGIDKKNPEVQIDIKDNGEKVTVTKKRITNNL